MSDITRSLTKVKSKISSKFKNTTSTTNPAGANEQLVGQHNNPENDQLLAMKYDDIPEDHCTSQEMVASKSFNSLNNIVEVSEEEDEDIKDQNQDQDQSLKEQAQDRITVNDSCKLLPPVSLDPKISSVTTPCSTNIHTTLSSHSSSIQEQELSFLQQSSNPTSPVVGKRHDSIVDPLNTSLINEKLATQLISPQSSTVLTNTISTGATTTPIISTTVPPSRRKSSNISNISLPQPITPTNEISLSQLQSQDNLEFADAMALSILDKVDENIKIEQEGNNTYTNIDGWTI